MAQNTETTRDSAILLMDGKKVTGLVEVNLRDWEGEDGVVCSATGVTVTWQGGGVSCEADDWRESFDVVRDALATQGIEVLCFCACEAQSVLVIENTNEACTLDSETWEYTEENPGAVQMYDPDSASQVADDVRAIYRKHFFGLPTLFRQSVAQSGAAMTEARPTWDHLAPPSTVGEHCDIVEQREGSITFIVDSVEPAKHRLSEKSAAELWAMRTGRRADMLSIDTELLVAESSLNFSKLDKAHPLVSAVHQAFAEHRPLVLTPDIVWLTICQGFGHHVSNHADSLRASIVDFEGQQRIDVKTEHWGHCDDWRTIITGLGDRLEQQVKHELADVMRCDFSTSTDDTRVASQIVLMHAMQRYFIYEIVCICGIPRITLKGTVDDWRAIQSRIGTLELYDLAWWTGPLSAIASQFVETADGRPSRDFWQSIYKPAEHYGAEIFHGWLGDLFPYLQDQDAMPSRRNPDLGLPLEEREGTDPAAIACGLASCPVRLHGDIPDQDRELIAGFVGIKQQPSLALEPVIGWGVFQPDAIVQMLQQIREQSDQHRLPTEGFDHFADDLAFARLPVALQVLYENWSWATFWTDTSRCWHLLSLENHLRVKVKDTKGSCMLFGQLSDGRYLGYRRQPGQQSQSLAVIAVDGSLERPHSDEPDPSDLSIAAIIEPDRVRVVSDNADAAIPRLFRSTGGFWFDVPMSNQ